MLRYKMLLADISKRYSNSTILPLLSNCHALISLIVLVFAGLYIYTLYPGIGGRINYGDSAKWQFLWAINGTPHSTGYPLFLILTKVFGETLTFLPIPTRITMASLLPALGTLALIYLISSQLITSLWARLLPVTLIASSVTFWSQATEPEVYAVNAFLFSSVIYLLIKYESSRDDRFLVASAFVYAISFGNHLTMITLLPGVIFLVASVNPRAFINPRFVLLVSVFILIGFSQYFYVLYLSHQGSPYLEYIGRNATVGRWISYITGGQFSENIAGLGLRDILLWSVPNFFRKAQQNISLPVVAIGFLPLLGLWSRFSVTSPRVYSSRRIILFLYLVLGGQLLYCLSYRIADIEVYFIPSYIVLAILAAYSIAGLPWLILRRLGLLTLLLVSLVNTTENIEYMKLRHNLRQSEVERIFSLLPAQSVLYIPMEKRYRYHGLQAINYFKFVAYREKGIRHLTKIPQSGEFYFMGDQLDEIKKRTGLVVQPAPGATDLAVFLEKYLPWTIVVSIKDDGVRGLGKRARHFLTGLGLNPDKISYRGSYVAIINKGAVVHEEINNDGPIRLSSKRLRVLGVDKVVSAGFSFGNRSAIKVGGLNVSRNTRGLNIAILRKGELLSTVTFDTHLSDRHVWLWKAAYGSAEK